MAGYSKDFRENPKRAIFILGRIDQEQVYRVTPDILRLRAESNEPITVYIDSPGGDTIAADDIRSLLSSPDQNGEHPRVITVVTNLAASAAADLLGLGDYAIAHHNSVIYCHGTRHAPKVALTTEAAASMAKSLRRTNEKFALRLARRAFHRAVFNYNNLSGEFDAARQQLLAGKPDPKPFVSDVDCFSFLLFTRISEDVRLLPKEAAQQQKSLVSLIDYVFETRKFEPTSDDPSKTQVEVLKLILDYHVSIKDHNSWRLVDAGLSELENDFAQFFDYYAGEYRTHLITWIQEVGELFLNDDEMEQWKAIRVGTDPDPGEWLRSTVQPRVHPLWYFAVSLSRLLQCGEFSLSPRDAYWLGIVDEVVGSNDLPCRRHILESALSNPPEST